jgi:ABC-type Fe3+ transport system permease subunit
MFGLRYGYILAVKLVLVALVILLTLAHSLVAGPRLLRLQEADLNATESQPADLAKARRTSVVLSALTLLLSLAVLFCAALLRGPFAFQDA